MVKNNNNLELPGIPKKRGRPSTGKAKSNAQRQAAFRKSLAVSASDAILKPADASVPALLKLLKQSIVTLKLALWVMIRALLYLRFWLN